MTTLTGKQIANSYKQLLQIGTDNSGIVSTLQNVKDGAGNNSALQLSNSTVNINGTFALNGVNITADASALNAITNFLNLPSFMILGFFSFDFNWLIFNFIFYFLIIVFVDTSLSK